MEGYIYQPLSELELTRVIVVEPGSINDEITCSLRTIPKQRLSLTRLKDTDRKQSDSITTMSGHSQPEKNMPGLPQIVEQQREMATSGRLIYDALSYVWGPLDLVAPIVCDGKNCRINRNLDQALRRFRKSDEQLYIWVDALCVNQIDTVERGEQVRIMKQIYEQAEQVRIWLGVEDEETPLVLRLLEAHLKKAHQPWFQVRTRFGPDAPEWAAMIRWLNRPWFWRVWTIQEARVATTANVYFGPHSINLAIVDSVLSLHVSRDVNQDLAGHLEEAFRLPGLSIRLNESSSRRGSLLNLLLLSRRHQATDLRDKVYGLLGLVQDLSEQDLRDPLIKPDYNKTTEMVYRETALFIMVKECSLRIIQATYHGEHFVRHKDVPSWVPRWDQQDGPILLGERSCFVGRSQEACGPVLDPENGERGVLSVKGTLQATVHVILSKMSQDELGMRNVRGQATVFDQLWAELRNEYGSPLYLENRHLILVFIETLTLGLNGRGEFFYYRYEDFFETLHCMWGHIRAKTESGATSPMFCSEEPYETSDGEEDTEEIQPKSTVRPVPSIDPTLFSLQTVVTNFPTRKISDEEDEETLSEISASSFQFDSGNCLLCKDPQEQYSHSSLHAYLTRNPNREELPGSEKDVNTFQYRINDFFREEYHTAEKPSLHFLAPCIDACNLRRLFITHDQRIGIGPQSMRPGDMITCLLGATFPCVLRKAEVDHSGARAHIGESSTFYHFIGECYIYDLDYPVTAGDGAELVVFDLV
ncbi:hypothetical protein JMJ35_009614 [Cladonia borealis]|uniref:Heterokaryon incompatibility domain-containing protein n=1 Tax=Cladonia borealis TaxID=184061 RepID=A0AA39QTE6_9LECA|nr:hypothetical protein JMJ35_009614 [Cladonia borealis]